MKNFQCSWGSRNISLLGLKGRKRKSPELNFWARHPPFLYILLNSKQGKKNQLCSWAYAFDFFSSWSLWIINKLISLYSSIFGDLKCSLKCTEQEECFSSNQLPSSLEMLALRYLWVFEINLLFSWEFLMAWRSGLLILPNALFKFGPFLSDDFLLLLCWRIKSTPLSLHYTPVPLSPSGNKCLVGLTSKWGVGWSGKYPEWHLGEIWWGFSKPGYYSLISRKRSTDVRGSLGCLEAFHNPCLTWRFLIFNRF